jgi:L-2-hydroxyglutarate oxidase LhgO
VQTADYSLDAVVIGAGVIGLAIGRALAQCKVDTLVLERSGIIGGETSSRSSEVIHAGIYYPPESLKARSCLRGRDLLYDYLHSRNLPYARCGKLIVATDAAEESRLVAIANRARQCGVNNLQVLSAQDVSSLEPEVRPGPALFSPSTGIFDSHQYMLALQGDLEAAGGVIALESPVTGGHLDATGGHLVSIGGREPTTVRCRILVNAAGLWSRDVCLRLTGAVDRLRVPQQYFASGHYYSYVGPAPFSHLIYPIPTAGGLGIHATLDLAGQVRFGPDVRWVESWNYTFDDSARAAFCAAIRNYFPALQSARLQPGYTGIRPKVVGPGVADGDFMVLGEKEHGIKGFFSLHGIESPGLTASLAIAESLADEVLRAS